MRVCPSSYRCVTAARMPSESPVEKSGAGTSGRAPLMVTKGISRAAASWYGARSESRSACRPETKMSPFTRCSMSEER